MAYLRYKAIDVHRFALADAIDSKESLRIIRRIPRGIEDDCAIRSDEIHAETSCFRGDEEQARPRVVFVIEELHVALAIVEFDGSVEPKVVLPNNPPPEPNPTSGHVERVPCGGIKLIPREIRSVAEKELDKVEGDEAL